MRRGAHRQTTEWVIIPSGILVDYKNKMVKDTTMKLLLFERAYSQVFIMYGCMYIIPKLQAHCGP